MRSRTIASIAIALMTAPSLQPLAGAQLPGQPGDNRYAAGAARWNHDYRNGSTNRFETVPAATVRLRQFDTTAIVGSVTAGPSGNHVSPGAAWQLHA